MTNEKNKKKLISCAFFRFFSLRLNPCCLSHSFSASLTKCLSLIYSAVSILSILSPTHVFAGIGRSSISSSLSLSGQVGRCYRRSLGQFYLTWPISSNISGNSLFGLRREHSCIDGKALNFFSSPSLSHLSIPPTHPPLSLSLSLSFLSSSNSQTLNQLLGNGRPPASWIHKQSASPR